MENNKPVILIGGGVSVSEGISLGLWDKIKGQNVWSLNYAYHTMPYLPSTQIWIDNKFFKEHIEELPKLSKAGVRLISKKHNMYVDIPEIQTYSTTSVDNEFNNKCLYVGSMRLVGTLALSLAVVEEFSPIFILGFDFGTTSLADKRTHYYYDDTHLNEFGRGKSDAYFLPDGSLKPDVKDYSIYSKFPNKIYNVSLRSNIPFFEKISYEYFFEMIKSYAQ